MASIPMTEMDDNGQPVRRYPVKLYKYRALKPFAHVAAIIQGKELHASRFAELNDPMEGIFRSVREICEEFLREIRRNRETVHICALSRTSKNPLMWAHYADGFKGICIEMEVMMSGAPGE